MLCVLSLKGQQVFQLVKDPLHVYDVEVDVVWEVCAYAGVGVHQGAVQGRAADADHHGNRTQQQQDQTRVSTRLICKQEETEKSMWCTI